jgi:hypothetical protein
VGASRPLTGHGSLAVTELYLHQFSEADRTATAHMGNLLDRKNPPPG